MARNPDEWFDVVDERDRVTGGAPRNRVHAEGLRHRAVHVLLFDRSGRVFLQRRSLRKDSAPGCWDSSCSGHLDAGETYRVAARRELGEELGLVRPPEIWPIFKEPAGPETGWEFVWVYRGRCDGPFDLHPGEIIEGRWMAPGSVDAEINRAPATFARSFILLWRRYRRIDRKIRCH